MQQPTRRDKRHGRGLLLALGLSASRAVGQQTSPFTDQATGAQLQRFVDAKTNFEFGIALPANPSSSFIGQLSFPLTNGAGWGGLSLGSDLKGPPLVACWADGNGGVVSSFRQSFDGEENPPEVQGAFSLKPIPDATSANSTFLTFTFLCENCIDDNQTAENAKLGWALASRPVQNRKSPAGVLASPDSGFGEFLANLAAARSTEFDTWAALAQPDAGTQTPIDEDAVVSDLKARQTGGQTDDGGQAGGRGGFNTDTDGNGTDFNSGVDSDTDDGRVRPITAGARVTRRRRRRAVAVSGSLGERQTGSRTGAAFTDTDNSGNDTDFFTDGFDSDTDNGRIDVPRAGARISRRRGVTANGSSGLAKRQTAGQTGGSRAGGFATDTDNTGNDTDFNTALDTDFNTGVDTDSDNGRRDSARVGRTARLARRQTAGRGRNRAGFNIDTDNTGNGTDFNSGFDTDSDVAVRVPARVSRVPARTRRLAARQARGRTGVNTDTDNSGSGTDFNSGLDTDSDNGLRAPRVNRVAAPRTRDLAKRQSTRQGQGRNGAITDTDNSGNGTDLSGFDSDSDNVLRAPRVTRVAAPTRRAVGGGATIPRGLGKRQTGGQAGARRDGFDTDSGNDTDFSDFD